MITLTHILPELIMLKLL